MGEYLCAQFSLQSTQWLEDIVLSAGSLKSAPLVAGSFAYLLLAVLSPESPDKVRRSLTNRYLAALLAPAVMAGVMQGTWPLLRDEPDLAYFVAIIFCAWFGGLGPGLFSVLISLLLIDYFIAEPHSFFWFSKGVGLVRLVLFAAVGLFIVVMTELMHREKRRAEINLESVKRAQSRIESVLSSVADVHILFDRDWRYLYVNEAAVRAIGRPREQIVGCTLWELYPDIVGTELDRQYRRAMDEGFQAAFEFHYLSRDTWWENRFYPAPEGLTVFATDITKRKRFEQELRQSEERFRQLAESITEVFWMTDPDKQRILYVSPAYEKIWGRSCENVYDQPTAWIDSIHPADRDRVERLAMTRQVTGGYDEEFRIIRPDGSVRWIRDRAFPIADKSGLVYRITGIAEDITERKLAEKKLRESEERFSKAFHSTPAALCIAQLGNGRLLEVNASFLQTTGYSSAEVIGKTSREIGLWVETDSPTTMAQTLRERGPVCDLEIKFRMKSGETRDGLLAVDVIELEDQSCVLGIIQDVTLRKHSEHALRSFSRLLIEAHEAERQSIARELHDQIGQVLTAVRLNLQSTQEACKSSEKNSLFAESIATVDEALAQVRDLSFELRPSLLDDLGLVTALRQYADRHAQRNGLCTTTTIDFPEALRLNRELETACFRIVQEALTNVARHAHACNVSLSLKMLNGEILLTIKDDGVGFDAGNVNARTFPINLGLRGMEERSLALGGRLDINSVPSRGTEICAYFPHSD